MLGCQTSRIPDDVEIIGKSAFSGCMMLTDVAFPAGLTEIEIPSGITKIGAGADYSAAGNYSAATDYSAAGDSETRYS